VGWETAQATLNVNLEGVEEVNAGFQQIGAAAEGMSGKVAASSGAMEISQRRLMLVSAGLIMNSVQLADIFDRMAKGQMDIGRGALMLAMNFLQLASQIWVVVGAENARAIAHSIANALSGPAGWAILAGAAAAVGVGFALASQIPSKQYGGSIETTGPYLLHAGEFVLPRGSGGITVNVYGAGSPQETANTVVETLRRSGFS
jgi:hypothetical protein